MTESGNTPGEMEPNGTDPGEMNNSASDTNGTEQSPQTEAAAEHSSMPAEATAHPSTEGEATDATGSATPTGDASAAPAPEPEATAPATMENVPQQEATPESAGADAGQPVMSGEGGAEQSQATASEGEPHHEGEAVEAGAEGAPAEGTTPRKGGRSWQPPPMTDERMREIWQELTDKKNANEEIELETVSQNRGGVVTHYKNVEVFIPMSHWTLDRHGNDVVSDAKPGTKILAHVLEMTDFDTDARRVTATRRSALRKNLLESFEVGQRFSGRVSTVLDFGIFVDLGGIDGLVHASEISHVRGRHPSELVKKGDEVNVVIREIDRDKERIYLGMKELEASPWEAVEEKYPEGTVQHGKVVGMTKLGAFVELEPGLDGFVRLRELSWTKRVHHPKEVLRKGMDVDVKVLDVSSRKQRLSLSYRQAQEDPWPTLANKYSIGTQWEGEIREISNKGVVVGVDDVEGFLPRGRMGRESKRLPEMKVGEKLPVNVIEVDPKAFSLIFGLQQPDREEEHGGGGERSERGGERGERRGGGRGGDRDRRDGDRGRQATAPSAIPTNEMKTSETVTSFTLGDMIGEAIKRRLNVESGETEEGTETHGEAAPVSASASTDAHSETHAEAPAAAAESAPAPEPQPESANVAEEATGEGGTATA